MSNYRHGHGKFNDQSSTYRSWAAMKRRCNNINTDAYKYYGGQGIGYDPSWEKFSVFLADMGERPEGTTLDRKDGEGGYSKANCRWASKAEQALNSSGNKLTEEKVQEIRALYAQGNISLQKIADRFGVSKGAISHIISGKNWKYV